MDATPLCLFWKGFTVAHHTFLDAEKWVELVEERSEGRITLRVYPNA